MFPPIDISIEHVRAGKLRALAATSAKRSEILADVPTLGEFLPGFEASVFLGIGAPKSTPAAIVGRLNKEINAALADPNIKTRYADLGTIVLGGSPADFGKLIAEDAEKWGKVIRIANIKAE
jgi:tripartite-type tricarboxylate transporter receptor subunit TctC